MIYIKIEDESVTLAGQVCNDHMTSEGYFSYEGDIPQLPDGGFYTFENGLLIAKSMGTDELIAKFKDAVRTLLDTTAESNGYRNLDSIAKYVGYNNAYRVECELLGAWAADVWVTFVQTETALNDSTLIEQTLDSLMSLLPPAP